LNIPSGVSQSSKNLGEFLLEVGCADAINARYQSSLVQTKRLSRPLCWRASTDIISPIAVPLWESVTVRTPGTLMGVSIGPRRDFFAGLSFFAFAMLSATTVTEAPVSSSKLAGFPSSKISADQQSMSSSE